ncbi:MAG: substrate-binding domain-containing protein [Rudaea sp.]|uniref:substrate-binding domain-containing protein n=1 Tax=Rudaea sp. TaxID=2136325 RepID=UPI0039E6C5E3
MTRAPSPLAGISSMAMRQVLAELAARCERETGIRVAIESVGGVVAAKRIAAGEYFDIVWLASDVIDKLAAGGRVVAGSCVDLMRSDIWVAVRAGALRPDVASEEAVRDAVREAKTLGYSTGPSGVYLAELFERWGIADEIAPRIVQALPGVPVGALIARGEIALGFQQRSEIVGLDGVDAIGPLPAAIQKTTVFSGAVCAASMHVENARALLTFMASAENHEVMRRHGMEPA